MTGRRISLLVAAAVLPILAYGVVFGLEFYFPPFDQRVGWSILAVGSLLSLLAFSASFSQWKARVIAGASGVPIALVTWALAAYLIGCRFRGACP